MSDEQKKSEGAVIVLLPAETDPINDASSQPAHMTLAWLGMAADLTDDAIAEAYYEAREYAAKADGPIHAGVKDRGVLGDENADVVFLEGEGIEAYREGLVMGEAIGDIMAGVEQYDEWTPHVTLGYPDEPAVGTYDGDTVVFDRLGIWFGEDRESFTLGEEDAMDEEEVEPEVAPEEEPEEQPETDEAGLRQWYGVLAPLNVESGDGRTLTSLDLRELPLPFKWMKEENPAHMTSVVVGNILHAQIVGNEMRAHGNFMATPEADELIALREQDAVRGVSVDLDKTVTEFMDGNGEVIPPFTTEPEKVVEPVTMSVSGRVAAATAVPIPAFEEGWFDLGAVPADWYSAAPQDVEEPVDEEKPEDEKPNEGPMEFKEYDSEQRKRMAKSGTAMPDGSYPIADVEDLKNAIQAIGRAKNPAAAKRHIKKRASALGHSELIPDSWSDAAIAYFEVDAVTASVGTTNPPKEWFENPELSQITPLTVTADGRVYGHVATWGVCHIGQTGRCIEPPSSAANYAYFHTGAVLTDDGVVPVGHITMKTGHADLSLSATATMAHYDNTAMVGADVHAGEDMFGIWVAGAVRPGLSEEDVYALRASAISGDWRRIGASMEMVAALAVNTPGFPIPRLALAASGSVDLALVAAAIVVEEAESVVDAAAERYELINEVVRSVREYDAAVAKAAAVRERVASFNQERLAALRLVVKEDSNAV